MSSDAFATLTAANALAKLAFSDLYQTFADKSQNAKENAPPAFQRMVIKDSQTFDGEVLRLQLENEQRVSQNAYAGDAETSESLPRPDSDTEEQHQKLGNIWPGYYEFRLKSRPTLKIAAIQSERAH